MTTLVRNTRLPPELWEIFSAADLVFSAAETQPDCSTDSGRQCHILGTNTPMGTHWAVRL